MNKEDRVIQKNYRMSTTVIIACFFRESIEASFHQLLINMVMLMLEFQDKDETLVYKRNQEGDLGGPRRCKS